MTGYVRGARPRVICHMMASVDGRIVVDGWPLTDDERAEYERVHDSYVANAWLVGWATVEQQSLATLRERGVSYLLAGTQELDLGRALEKIGARLGVRTLMLEGGGGMNGSMLRAGLVDELSLLVAPVADGRVGTAALFDIVVGATPQRLALESVERRAGDMLWLRYRLSAPGASAQ